MNFSNLNPSTFCNTFGIQFRPYFETLCNRSDVYLSSGFLPLQPPIGDSLLDFKNPLRYIPTPLINSIANNRTGERASEAFMDFLKSVITSNYPVPFEAISFNHQHSISTNQLMLGESAEISLITDLLVNRFLAHKFPVCILQKIGENFQPSITQQHQFYLRCNGYDYIVESIPFSKKSNGGDWDSAQSILGLEMPELKEFSVLTFLRVPSVNSPDDVPELEILVVDMYGHVMMGNQSREGLEEVLFVVTCIEDGTAKLDDDGLSDALMGLKNCKSLKKAQRYLKRIVSSTPRLEILNQQLNGATNG
ncbi:hypothetical protein [Vibrio alginolyticus]|uniref:hypothetical protein n=1 Tax=Vibrio alginolyticus TaxID=663 RepID=UPI0006CA6B9F|nr:hypothetical protein [Vibrio alginolyticus]KPM98643.1 hypothetical protein AOG25_09495 [Vibrio alginolyticus]CAH7164246.1 conserved hypothetical protein [Vibrio chagasii]CAH7334073.1 conserved hypothetical protein [Vibrio chagasii]